MLFRSCVGVLRDQNNPISPPELEKEDSKDKLYDMIRELVTQNFKELTNSVIESNNKILATQNNNTTINNNVKVNQINKFNLNFFLNDTCKDALNMSDFLNTIVVSLEDLENTVKLGYTVGITKMIIDRINSIFARII